MISRLTFSAAVFAAITTVSLAYAADSHQRTEAARSAAATPATIVVMPTVEITGRRAR